MTPPIATGASLWFLLFYLAGGRGPQKTLRSNLATGGGLQATPVLSMLLAPVGFARSQRFFSQICLSIMTLISSISVIEAWDLDILPCRVWFMFIGSYSTVWINFIYKSVSESFIVFPQFPICSCFSRIEFQNARNCTQPTIPSTTGVCSQSPFLPIAYHATFLLASPCTAARCIVPSSSSCSSSSPPPGSHKSAIDLSTNPSEPSGGRAVPPNLCDRLGSPIPLISSEAVRSPAALRRPQCGR
jgi:hypothetical protein